MPPKDVDRMANRIDPDQTGAVWSGSILFAILSTLFVQQYMSQYLEFLR